MSAHGEDGDIDGEAGQASVESRDILRDVDDVTTVRILPFLEAVDVYNGSDLCDEHLLNLHHFNELSGYVSRVHVIVMSLSAEKALGFFLSLLQRLDLCVCENARYIKLNMRRIM